MLLKITFLCRFNWTDGKLNSSNLIELSGQITEKFDEEFRILYAQSLPMNTRGPLSVRNGSIYEPLLLKHSVASSPYLAREKPAEPACLTSTPSRKPHPVAIHPPREPLTPDRRENKTVSVLKWTEQPDVEEEILAGSTARRFPAENEPPGTVSCHSATQTSQSVTDSQTQTDLQLTQSPDLITPNITGPNMATSPSLVCPNQAWPTHAPPDKTLKDCFHKLSKERREHYSIIRSKLEHIVSGLSQERVLAEVSNMTETHSRQRVHKDCGQEPNPTLLVECVGTGAWPRARCVQ